jgi:hypothetical protein
MSANAERAVYPAVMDHKLRRIRRRQSVLAVLRGAFLATAALLAAMLAAMSIDGRLTLFDARARLLLTGAALAFALVTLAVSAGRPLRKTLRLRRAAGQADEEVPQLEERWTTVSHFAEQGEPPQTPLGSAMLRQVASEAVALGRLVEPARVARTGRLRRSLLLAAACMAALAGFLLMNRQQNLVLLQRFWAPWADISATRVESVTGDAAIPRGDAVELVVNVSGLRRSSATLFVDTGHEAPEQIELTPEAERPERLVYRLAALEESFRYRVQAGDGRTPWHAVTAIDRPSLAEVRFTLTAPDYVDRPQYEKPYLPDRARALAGSRLSLQLRPEAELASLELLITRGADPNATPEPFPLAPDADGWYRFETMLAEDITLSPVLFSPHGLNNTDRPSCHIRVIADRPPVARVTSPTEEQAVGAQDVVEVKFEAHDDHGIAKAELVVYGEPLADGEQPPVLSVKDIPLGEQELSRHVQAATQLDLSRFDLMEGEKISFAVRVSDNRTGHVDAQAAARRERNKNASGEATERHNEVEAFEPGAPAVDDAKKVAMDSQGAAAGGGKREGEGKTNENAASVTDSSRPHRDNKAEIANRGPGGKPRGNAVAATQKKQAERGAVAVRDKSAGSDDASKPAAAPEPGKPADANAEPTADAPRGALATAADESVDSKEKVTGLQRAASNKAKEDAIAAASPDAAAAGETSVPRAAAANDETDAGKTKPEQLMAGQPGNRASDVAAVADRKPESKDEPAAQRKVGTADAETDARQTADADALAGGSGKQADDKQAQDSKTQDSKTPATGEPRLAASSALTASTGEQAAEKDAGDKAPPVDEGDPQEPKSGDVAQNTNAAAVAAGDNSSPSEPGAAPLRPFMQDEAAGQNAESNRLRLKITARLASAGEQDEHPEESPLELRERIVRIDRLLRESQAALEKLVEQAAAAAIADPQIKALGGADKRLVEAERMIAELREQSKDTPLAFAGLQMVEIDAAHISPARDRLFAVVRQPDAEPEANLLEALHRVSRARELLDELLARYDRVVQERKLADSLEEVAEMYEVYVSGAHRLLRAQTKPSGNPLQRKMAILELDQEYLDRLREVIEMRRDLMSEFGRLLGDDPRLRSKYLDVIKRRRTSLRDQFGRLYERQTAAAAELAAWRQVDETQREDVWAMAAELRLQDVSTLVKDASQLQEHVTAQLPLGLDPAAGAAAAALDQARQIAVHGRAAAVKSRRLMRNPFDDRLDLTEDMEAMGLGLSELGAALERLAAEHDDEETADFTAQRLAETRTLGQRLSGWTETAANLHQQRYAALIQVDQQRLAADTDDLRTALQNADDEFNGQFRGEVPPEVQAVARELDEAIEAITFNQTAAAYSLSSEDLGAAEVQQSLALEAFKRAEALFDQMRKAVIDALDQTDPDNPTVADLEDPTLDKFLEQLEREPNLGALLGIPDRPRNLKVLSDWMLWNSQGGSLGAMGESARRARRRAEMQAKAPPKPGSGDRKDDEEEEAEPTQAMLAEKIEQLRRQAADPEMDKTQAEKLRQAAERLEELRQMVAAREGDDDRTEEEWRQLAQAEQTEEMLQQQIEELRRRAADPELDQEQAAKLRQQSERLEAERQRRAAAGDDGGAARKKREERARAEQLRAMIEALAADKTLPDVQWNRVLSSLDDGLWQVRRRTPPEQYRKAIEQYQERIRRLRGLETSDAASP